MANQVWEVWFETGDAWDDSYSQVIFGRFDSEEKANLGAARANKVLRDNGLHIDNFYA